MDLKLFPWDNGEEPYFVNEEDYKWYIDESTTNYAQKSKGSLKGLENIVCFFIKKGKRVTRVLVDDKQNILYENTSLEAIAAKIDMLKIAGL
jgi:hypothetical protein